MYIHVHTCILHGLIVGTLFQCGSLTHFVPFEECWHSKQLSRGHLIIMCVSLILQNHMHMYIVHVYSDIHVAGISTVCMYSSRLEYSVLCDTHCVLMVSGVGCEEGVV